MAAGVQAAVLNQYVNPFIGTKPGAPGYIINNSNGNVFPGAVWPNGMVQFSPDTPDGNAGGYLYTSREIKGFSLTHFSGRGIKCWMDFPILPTVGTNPGQKRRPSKFSHRDEVAAPGYYRARLDDSAILAELTATARTGFARFTFTAGQQPVIQIDTQGDASSARGGSLQIVSNNTVSGETTGHGGGGKTITYKLYFYARFDHSFIRREIWKEALGANLFFENTSKLSPQRRGDAEEGQVPSEDKSKKGTSTSDDTSKFSPRRRGDAEEGSTVEVNKNPKTFDPTPDIQIQMKVGISFVNIEGAKANLEAENPGWEFDSVRKQAVSKWNERLSRIQVTGGTVDQKTVFYTSLYHASIHPNIFSDADGRYIGFDQQIHTAPKGHDQYENFAAWDNYRTLMPLLSILEPKMTSDMIQSLVNMAEQDKAVRPNGGGLPRWQQANGNTGGMEGDCQDVVIASAYALGVRDFDTTKALAAMERGASVTGTTSGGREVRPGLSDWLKQGYMPMEGSLNLEYANDDFAVAQFAHALGDEEKYQVYLKRSGIWKNIFNPDWGNGGYFVPRTWFGNFIHWFPTHCGVICGFDESNSDQYTWLLPFSYPDLFQIMGGPAVVLNRLNAHFFDETGKPRLNEGPDSRYAFLGNEPESAAPYVYLFAGAPEKTFEILKEMVTKHYRNSADGMPGNDDGGAIGSWVVWAMMGLRPVVLGTDQVALTGPMFDSVALSLEGGKTLNIKTIRNSPSSAVLNRVTFNDKDVVGNLIPWSDLAKGGNLEFHYR